MQFVTYQRASYRKLAREWFARHGQPMTLREADGTTTEVMVQAGPSPGVLHVSDSMACREACVTFAFRMNRERSRGALALEVSKPASLDTTSTGITRDQGTKSC
ncbi:MAG TPA: hypothetical protein VGK17_04845 [Propionicimonas sp.]